MSEDIELQIKQSFNDSSTKWAIQLDETTDISNKAQLLAFLRTTGADIFELVDENDIKYNLRWENCVSVCTDGAPAMKDGWVVNPFMHCEIQHLEEEMQENLIDLKNDLVFKRLFTEKELSEFWLCLNSKFPKLSNAAIESLLPFGSSYLCEQGFSTLTEIKSKKRERLQMIDEDMRVCLSQTTTDLLLANPTSLVSANEILLPFLEGGNINSGQWLKEYKRVSKYNRWDETMKLANVVFYLNGTAGRWFDNNEESLNSWRSFEDALRGVFGLQEDSARRAKEILELRTQKVNPRMEEGEIVALIIKGISEDTYHVLLAKDIRKTVDEILKFCRHLATVKERRISRKKFAKFQTEEIQKVFSASKVVIPLREINALEQTVREEVSRALQPMRPQVNVEDGIMENLHDKPICFHCGRPGHVVLPLPELFLTSKPLKVASPKTIPVANPPFQPFSQASECENLSGAASNGGEVAIEEIPPSHDIIFECDFFEANEADIVAEMNSISGKPPSWNLERRKTRDCIDADIAVEKPETLGEGGSGEGQGEEGMHEQSGHEMLVNLTAAATHHQQEPYKSINQPPYPCKICASHQLPNQIHFHRDCPLKNNTHPKRINPDASSLGVAGVLKQPDEQGILHPIGYFSRKLHPYEQNYTASEIETLAIINSVQRFHTYLHNIHFTLHTDHLPLKWIKNVKNPQETNAKVERLNSTIINRLRCEYNANLKIPWTKYIPKITESYNETVHTTTGFTPKFLYYGIQPQYIEHCTETHTPIEKARKLAIERTIKSHEHSKKLYDIKHPEPIFKEGDQTSHVPIEQTSQIPIKQTSQVPIAQTSYVPIEQTSQIPIEQTSQVPIEQTSQVPIAQTSHVPIEQTSQIPIEQTSQVPIAHTSQDPTTPDPHELIVEDEILRHHERIKPPTYRGLIYTPCRATTFPIGTYQHEPRFNLRPRTSPSLQRNLASKSNRSPSTVHKPDIPLRPIVAYHLSPAAHLARYLSDVLKPLIKTYNSHSIQDSSDFIHKLKEIDNSENYSICTYDVKSLFLCLPHDLIIKELRKLLASSDLPHTQSCTITDLFQICLNMNTLEFDGHYYLQKRGSPMGSPLSNIAAELLMSGLDSWITNRDDLGIKLWIRYVDDIFCMYPKANNSLITDALNAYQECLKFTQNQDKNGVIPFLDVLVINTDSNIETTVYYKPEFNPTYIHYGSHAPVSHKITTIKTLTKRISTHCSLEIFKTVERNNIYRNLSSFGYPIDFIRRHTYQQRTYTIPTVYKSTCVLPYSETKVDIARFLRKYGVHTHFSNSPSVELKLRHPITKSSKKQDPLSASNAVYKIKCSNCELHYVGETGRTIEIRTKEHNRNIMNKDSRSQIYQHMAETQHSFDFTDTQCIYSNIIGKYQRLVLEALVSNKIPSLNRKIELPPQYIAFCNSMDPA
ncbi:hypothetical protein LAZ67_20001559 [Cordylochernes scorpioides]|uniref:Reverse transcriptase domain-containing protein n=1 Tax=Cordylochernes scorpioides TaxID=51811 RepID=A0ABY6LPY3_9ARAC|nr:hypothetical protein LAZ67_20001559 [Cordylochernes scorpioides]